MEFRQGASNDEALKKIEERRQQEIKKAKERENWTDADWDADFLNDLFTNQESYSETYQTRKDGSFDLTRKDGFPISVLGVIANTPEKFYQTASEIQKKHPDWHFEFDVDPSTRRFKYTVTKEKPENK